jgi:hypothetical protein
VSGLDDTLDGTGAILADPIAAVTGPFCYLYNRFGPYLPPPLGRAAPANGITQ